MVGSKPFTQALVAVNVIHTAFPILASVYFMVASCVRILWPPEISEAVKGASTWRLKHLYNLSILAVIATYVIEAVAFLTGTPSETGNPGLGNSAVYPLSSALVWFATLLSSPESPAPIGYPTYGFWLIYLAAEVALFSIFRALGAPHDNLSFSCQILRISLVVLLLCTTLVTRIYPSRRPSIDEETAPLLASETSPPENGIAYGSCDSQAEGTSQADSETGKPDATKSSGKEDAEEADEKEWGVWDFIENFKILLPFFWPSGRLRLQLIYVAIALCLVAERAINVLIPLQVGHVTNMLTRGDGVLPWKQILIYAILRLLDSGCGLEAVHRFLWLPLENYSYEQLSTTGFNQIMTLSCDFHDSKHSGELWQTVYYAQSVKDVVNKIFFDVIPMIADLVLAVSVLYYIFDAYMALIVAAVGLFFVWSSGKVIVKQREKRRDWLKKRTEEYKILTESTSNWRTVSYFNRIPHEQSRYHSAVGDQLRSRNWYSFWYQVESTAQSFSLTFGLMVACFMAAYQVSSGKQPIGSFVMLLGYWGQLSGPLQLIANGLGDIAIDIVDVEEFLDLLRKKPTVTDRADAKSMVLTKGDVEFSNINYSYDGKREVLRDVNFHARAGQTTAFVGQTGGGKSTILKLLFRFYDATSGAVKVDGQDVSKVTLSSLREQIGVVPQDPTLFHDTIMNNIRYANFEATDEDVIEACKAVALHERFISFTDGYKTMVGDFGVKLSGGELQRVAIARAIIKKPRIVLLDEATSSVDSETEGQVQESLKKLSEGRTTLVIAHRLSTIMNADNIVVVNNGTIVEQGTHAELLRNRGYYYQLCSRQGVVDATDRDGQGVGVGVGDIVRDADFENAAVVASVSGEVDVDAHSSGQEESLSKSDELTGRMEHLRNGQVPGPDGIVPQSNGSQMGMAETGNHQGPKSSTEQLEQTPPSRVENLFSPKEISPQNGEATRTPQRSTPRTRALTRSEPTGHELTMERHEAPGVSNVSHSQLPASEDNAQSSSFAKKEETSLSKNQKRRRRKKHFRIQSKQDDKSKSSDTKGQQDTQGGEI